MTRGSYLVFNIHPSNLGESPKIDVGYKYNYLNIISFIATEGEGRNVLDVP